MELAALDRQARLRGGLPLRTRERFSSQDRPRGVMEPVFDLPAPPVEAARFLLSSPDQPLKVERHERSHPPPPPKCAA